MTVKCSNCGLSNDDNARFCSKCGTELLKRSFDEEFRRVIILFVDISDFTSLSTRYDPEELKELLDGSISLITEEIENMGGTIDKYLGDGVLALFGIPLFHEDDAERAVRASLAIQSEFDKMSVSGDDKLKVRVGIHSGDVVTGEIGTTRHKEYTVLGSAVNIAKRVEECAEPGEIVVSGDIFEKTRHLFEYINMGERDLRGLEKPMKIYKVDGMKEEVERPGGIMTDFVGRENSLGKLITSFEKIRRDGEFCVVNVMGEAGIGKTRLLEEALSEIEGEDYLILKTYCSSYNINRSFNPLIDILRDIFDIRYEQDKILSRGKILRRLSDVLRDEDIGMEKATQFISGLLSVDPLDEDYIKTHTEEYREVLFTIIGKIFANYSKKKPTIMVIDDFHWADDSTITLLTSIIEDLKPCPVILVLLTRQIIRDRYAWQNYRKRLLDEGVLKEIVLMELDETSSFMLIKKFLDTDELPEGLNKLVLRISGGNPYFIEEYLTSLIENKNLIRDEDGWIFQKEKEDFIPENIAGVLRWRLDRLSGGEREVINYASVIGLRFRRLILDALLNRELDDDITNLKMRGMITEVNSHSLDVDTEYEFKHEFLRDITYNAILKKKKRTMHNQVGRELEKIYKEREYEDVHILAQHYKVGECWDKAYEYLRLSGELSQDKFAYDEALKYFGEARNLFDKVDITPDDRAYILEKIGMCEKSSGNNTGSIEYFNSAIDMYEDIESKAHAYSHLVSAYNILGDLKKAVKSADKGIDLLGESSNSLSLVNLFYEKARVLIRLKSDLISSMELCEKALEILPEIDDEDKKRIERYKGRIYMILGIIYNRKRDYQKAIECYEQSREYYEGVDIIEGVRASYHNIGLIKLMTGDYDEAMRLFELDMEITQNIGHPLYVAWAKHSMGRLLTRINEIERAKEHFSRAIELNERQHNIYSLLLNYYALSRMCINLKEYNKAMSYADKLIEKSEDSDYGESSYEWKYLKGKIHCYRGDVEEAQKTSTDYIQFVDDKSVFDEEEEFQKSLLKGFSDMIEMEGILEGKSGLKDENFDRLRKSCEHNLLKSYNYSEKIKDIEEKFEINHLLTRYYTIIKDDRKTGEYLLNIKDIFRTELSGLTPEQREKFLSRPDRKEVLEKFEEFSISL